MTAEATAEPTDDELIAATLAGELAAYDQLMRRYERLVFKVAYGFSGTREGALDVTGWRSCCAISKACRYGTSRPRWAAARSRRATSSCAA